MRTKQILICKDTEKVLKTDLQYTIKVEPVVLTIEKEKYITINECNAAEKIENYPEAIQKLVWRVLHYKCEIEARRSMPLRTPEHFEKLTKYIEAFRNTKKLIMKMCKRNNLNLIVIDGNF